MHLSSLVWRRGEALLGFDLLFFFFFAKMVVCGAPACFFSKSASDNICCDATAGKRKLNLLQDFRGKKREIGGEENLL